jgi:GTP-binding protein Era
LNSNSAYHEALASVEQTLGRLRGCTEDEKSRLRNELAGLRAMHDKLTSGRVEIVIFGEISTGKSALINALVGSQVSAVDVRGGWTKEVWHVAWSGAGYSIPGLGRSIRRALTKSAADRAAKWPATRLSART